MRTIDCTITIKDLKSLTFESEESGRMREIEGTLGSDPFAQLTIERMNYWVHYAIKVQEQSRGRGNPCQLADLQVMGLNLYRILFGDPRIQERFSNTLNVFEEKVQLEKESNPNPDLRMRLRLVFERGAESLGRLPWEFLFIPGEGNDIGRGFFFAGEKTELILTRFVPPSQLVGRMVGLRQETLRILVAVSRPVDKRSDLGEISRDDADLLLAQIRTIATADIHEINNPDYEALKKEIETVQPHIFHFIGHGRAGSLALVLSQEDPEYDESLGEKPPRWVDSQQFRKLFNVHRPRLIFLHACKGAASTSQDAFNSTARELVYADIPAVVAMQYSISNQDAAKFARRFYEELGKGREIDEAVKEGRLALGQVFPPWEHPRFGTPVVYLQTNDAMVLPVAAAGEPGEEPLPAGRMAASPSALPGVAGEGSRPKTAPGRAAAAGAREGSGFRP